MLGYWSLLLLVVSLLILIAGIVLSRIRHIRVRRGVIFSSAAAVLTLLAPFLMLGSITFSPDDLPFFVKILLTTGIILAFNAIIEMAKWLLTEYVARQRHIRLPEFLIDLAGWMVLLGGAIAVVGEIFDMQLTGLVVSSTVVSAVIALSMQQIIASIFAGITLQFEAPYLVDDWVEIDGLEGQVVRHNWRTLTLMTRKGGYLILPNGKVAQGTIVNHSRPDPRNALEVSISVPSENAPGTVKRILLDALTDIEGVDHSLPAEALVASYNGANTEYRVRFWYRDYGERTELQDVVLTRFWYALARVGLGMAKKDDPQKQADAIAETLRSADIFDDMTEEQVQQMAQSATLRRYASGERLVRQNDAGDSLFIIKSGRVGIYVNGATGKPIHVNDISTCDFFGEMSLLTGEPRSASAVAEGDVEVIVIDKDALTQVLTADPTILEALLNALDRRRTELRSILAEDSARVQAAHIPERSDLLRRIGQFLGLSSPASMRRATS
jgi:small-conductance mechanosensitive channel/CRP-like cAMP-binding protein